METSFEVIETTPHIARVGLRDAVEKRKALTVEICAELKSRFSEAVDEACHHFTTCTDDKRSYFSYAYLFGALPQSIQEIVSSDGEVKQEAVEKLISEYEQVCKSTNRSVERIIHVLSTLTPERRTDDLRQKMAEVDDTDEKIKSDLAKSPTWLDVYVLEE